MYHILHSCKQCDQHFAGLKDQGALRIGDHDGRTLCFGALYDVRPDEKPVFIW